jgi:hypothetical protein
MEKIMSKSNDTSKLDRVKIETRVLADSELDAVSGGWLPLGGIPGYSVPQPHPPKATGNVKWSDIQLKGGV